MKTKFPAVTFFITFLQSLLVKINSFIGIYLCEACLYKLARHPFSLSFCFHLWTGQARKVRCSSFFRNYPCYFFHRFIQLYYLIVQKHESECSPCYKVKDFLNIPLKLRLLEQRSHRWDLFQQATNICKKWQAQSSNGWYRANHCLILPYLGKEIILMLTNITLRTTSVSWKKIVYSITSRQQFSEQ